MIIYRKEIPTTIDNEWEDDELNGITHDVCLRIFTPELIEKYKYRALMDKNLLKPQYMAERILNQIDVIQVYNQEYEEHKDDNDGCDIIDHYEHTIIFMVYKILEENLLT